MPHPATQPAVGMTPNASTDVFVICRKAQSDSQVHSITIATSKRTVTKTINLPPSEPRGIFMLDSPKPIGRFEIQKLSDAICGNEVIMQPQGKPFSLIAQAP